MELCDATDLKTDHLFRELHPDAPANDDKKSFAKPKAPTRGPRRLVKAADTPDE